VPEDSILHYRIEQKIGEGGMGEVYLATDTKLDRKVALKFLPESLRKDPEARERLLREAKAASKLSHSNIVTVFAVEEAEGRDFIAMEYIEGLLLSEFAEQKQPNLRDSLGIAIGMASGLQKAHEAGIVHRDLKPSNILVDVEGKAKILDFGVAKMEGASKLTETGSTVGTVAYMSPEQAQGAEVDARSDLFGLGAMLYELVAGQLPFRGDHQAAILYAITNEEADPLARYKADVPDELQRIITKCLAKDRGNRYQSAADLVTDLKQLRRALDGTSAVQSSVTSTPSAPAPKSRSKLLVGGGLVLAVIVLALVIRPWRITIEPTDRAEALGNRLAILYFDNLADPSDEKRHGEISANLLITDLSETPNLDVVSTQRLFDLLHDLGYEGHGKIDRNIASRVADMAGARWMLQGSILQVVPHVVLTAQIIDTETGSSIASQRIEGDPGETIFAITDRLSEEVRADLSVPQTETGFEPATANVTTTSEEAYRHYLEGVEQRRKFRHDLARDAFGKAIALDSSFAMAYHEWSKVPEDRPLTVWLVKKALEHSKNASPKEQLGIQAMHASVVDRDYELALKLDRQIIERYPGDPDGYLGAYYGLRDLEKLDSALMTLEMLVKVDPYYKDTYNQLAYGYQQVGNFERSLWAINKYIELAGDEPNPYDSRADLYLFEGMLQEAKANYALALTRDPDFVMSEQKLGHVYMYLGHYDSARAVFQKLSGGDNKDMRQTARTDLAALQAYGGHFREALEVFSQGIAADRMEGLTNVQFKSELRAWIFSEVGMIDSAIAQMLGVWADRDTSDVESWQWVPSGLVILYGEAGTPERAMPYFAELDAVLQDRPNKNIAWWYYQAHRSMAINSYDSAIHYLEQARRFEEDFWTRHDLGRAHLSAGNLGQAVEWLERAVKDYGHGRSEALILNVTVYYELGRAYEESGWTDKAIATYEKFLNIWRDADPGLAKVEDARARLARLKTSS
jgi:serine/threonine protein kinase/Tfp pilus assembly protein PilF